MKAYLAGHRRPDITAVDIEAVFEKKVLVPTYYDNRYDEAFQSFLRQHNLDAMSIGELTDKGILKILRGHGSPSNDQRCGHIPYVKVSDIRALRINVNPTNLVSEAIARRFWRGTSSGLQAWDLITPNRASSNIGEFAILLPGEEELVLTKEVFVFRVGPNELWDPFYLLWALSLKVVRDQWRRVALMQTNREDCGHRYREVLLPQPKSKAWAAKSSAPFRNYFTTLAKAKESFVNELCSSGNEFVASAVSATLITCEELDS